MNKLFTKIAALALGATMALGVGVAVASTGKDASRVDATVGSPVTIGNGTYDSIYETGFEGFTAGTTYNSTQTYSSSQTEALGWKMYYGTVSTNAKITGSNSAQMRFYLNKQSNFGYIETTSSIAQKSVKAFKFNYAVSDKGIKFDVKYGTNGTSWTKIETVTPGNTNVNSYSHEFSSAISSFYLRIEISDTVSYSGTSGNKTFRVDDIVFGEEQAVTTYSVTYNPNAQYNIDGMPDPEMGLSTGPHSLSSATPTRWGYTFGGWAASDSSTTPITSVTITDSNITVYAIWTADTTVKGAHASNPYTVAEAKTAIDAGEHLYENFVAGKISQIDKFDSQYSSITYWISDDGTTSGQLEVYSGKGLNGADFSAITDIEVGGTVVVCGTLKKYNSTYEFDKNNYLISYTEPVITVTHTISFNSNGGTDPEDMDVGDGLTFQFPSPGTKSGYIFKGWTLDNATFYQEGDHSFAIDDDYVFDGVWQTKGTSADPYTVGEALTAITNNTGIKSACVSGTISTVGSFSSGAITYYISSDGTTSNQLEVYKGKGLNGADFSSQDDLSTGTVVVVQGNLKDYNGTAEFDSGSIILSIVEKFTVTYDANGATSGTVPTDSSSPYVSGGTVTVLGNTGTLVKTGFTWSGWNTQNDGQGAHYDANDTFTISANTTLYAEWAVTLDAITSIGGTVTGLVSNAGTTNWDFSNVTVTGTISGVANQDVKAYVDLTSATTIPSTATASMTVSVTATRKSTIPGTNTPLTDDITGSVTSYENSSSLIPGDYYIKYGTRYFTGSVSSGKGASSTDKPGNAGKFTFNLIGNDTWSIVNAEGHRLGISGNSTTSVFVGENDTYTFLIIDGENGTFKLNSRDVTNRFIGYYETGSDFRSYTSTYPIELTLESAKTVSSFSVNTEGANKNVLKNSTFDAAAAQAAGFQARLNYTDSTYDDVTLSATWTLNTGTVGTATLTVTYQEYDAVTINDMNIYVATIVSLSIDTTNAKTSGYWTGDQLVTDGLVITGYDSFDNEYSIAVGDCTFSPTTLNTAGNSITITVSYANESGTPAVATGTYTVSVSQFAYSKSTSINGGDRILFVGFKSDLSEYRYLSSIGALSSNTGGIATVYTDKPGTENYYDVVAGVNDGTVAFKNSEGKYLNGATVKNLSLSNDITADTSWTVSFTDDVPTIANVSVPANIIKYNASSPRFVTYANDSAIQMNVWKLNGTSGQAAAEDFASEFIADVVNDVCKAFGPTFNDDMETMWALYAESYAALSSEAKAYIASKSANASGDDVEKMLYEYKHIYETYGDELNISNFLGRIEVSKAPLAPRTPIVNIVGENGNAITIVVIVSVISLTAIGGYFFLRKRREQN